MSRWVCTVCCWMLVLCLWTVGLQGADVETEGKTIEVTSAGIACSEALAARVGLAVLKEGGNAVDAAVSVAFALAVTYPVAGNIGGGGFLLYRSAEGETRALDFRETAPAGARLDMYWDEQGRPVPEKSRIGALAVGVPGTVRGLYLAHSQYGKLPWSRLLAPAIRLARKGFAVYPFLAERLARYEEQFKQFPESYRIFFPRGRAPKPGELLQQPDLANTLEAIAREGDAGFYTGPVAQAIVRAVKSHGGVMAQPDLENYRAVFRKPVQIRYGDFLLYSMPPPSSGGLVLQGILNTLQATGFSADRFPHNGADYIALLSEIEKRWYAYRNAYLGDPDFVHIPWSLFASPEKAKEIARSVSLAHPFPARQLPAYRLITSSEKPETTHLSVVDQQGNAVSMTYTLNGAFGSFLVAEGTGVLLNNEMDDFAARPGYPNLYKLVQGWANAIAPGKRMLSSMTPTLVVHDGDLEGVLGTPGGSTIITSVLQVFLNRVAYQMPLDQALAAGRFHQQWLPDSVFVEKDRFSPTVIQELNERGFHIVSRERIGDVQAIWRSQQGWVVGADPRGNGLPVGF
ncbi:MAG: gamma-glutamyltransferase [Calditrichaeota bacterium]|nr:MAG: gamma-glutamyltransferase [Calditrichota bacterium]